MKALAQFNKKLNDHMCGFVQINLSICKDKCESITFGRGNPSNLPYFTFTYKLYAIII